MTLRSRRLPAVLAAAALASLGLAACGGDDSSSSSSSSTEPASTEAPASSTTAASGGEGSTVNVAADPNGDLAFTQTDLTAKAGNDTIEFENASTTPHNVEIESADGEEIAGTDTISGGKTSTTADLQPGTYTFFCAVPGHREAGMEGTITVK
jgi:plastocyanin